ncbi:MAG: hypothetical protein FWC80_01675 [Firmicutes bacterium]|nr:hypothetical protein [Bacillota bacterium]
MTRKIVQFPHPQSEYKPNKHNKLIGKDKKHTAWKLNNHCRRFIKTVGSYVDGKDNLKTSDICFWGEFEGVNVITDISSSAETEKHPHFLHTPCYVKLKDYDNVFGNENKSYQNTDPYVFGNSFMYSNCKMTGQMRELAKGSIIIFGGLIKGEWCVDTVFVVEERLEKRINSLDDAKKMLDDKVISQEFYETTLAPIFFQTENDNNTRKCGSCSSSPKSNTSRPEIIIYKGATYDNQINDMYSFFPCKPYNNSEKFSFARPQIKLDIMTPNLKQNLKYCNESDISEEYSIWNEIKEQIIGKGLYLGVSAEEPKKLEIKNLTKT